MHEHEHKHTIDAPALSLRRFGAISACDVHTFHQIVLGLDGAMEMAVDGVGHRIDARRAWLIPAGELHEYVGIGENRQLVLDVPCASLALPERIFSRAVPLTMNEGLTGVVHEAALLAARIDAASGADRCIAGERDAPGHEARAVLLARRLAWDTAARLAVLIGDSIGVEVPASGLDYARIDKWLRAHLSEPLRVTDLAAHCGFGERRFHQLFDEAFGTTPHRYLQRLRLDTALTLLCDPRPTLIDVALTVGFADQSAFTHAFTRRFGVAPGQWRAMRMH
ncbi:AraC family transcriptional regulator [Trinickia dinghuensis]|uniref:AraC family transcriptional regulator n=1 Tax=Trinickia dinghuensis TaxID=2291023 RepID=A0A3D8JQY6_9BURK|nr:AraC family transcriptional regulator [Trinickia dinghuensis]RDU95106.1 AraC family transcriptional regulator [Trinickia dinghuensis]